MLALSSSFAIAVKTQISSFEHRKKCTFYSRVMNKERNEAAATQ